MGCGQQEEFRACADIAISNQHSGSSQGTNQKTFWKERRKNTIVNNEKKSWNRKIDREKNSYKYSLSGKNSYSFFSFDVPSSISTSPSKKEEKGKDSTKNYFNKKLNKNKRRKLKAEIETKKIQPVSRRVEEPNDERTLYTYSLDSKGEQPSDDRNLYTYSLDNKASRSHTYFWSGVSTERKSKPLHQPRTAAVTLQSVECSSDSSTKDLLASFMENFRNFREKSKLLTKIFLCKIYRDFCQEN